MFYIEEYWILYTIQLSGEVFRRVLDCQLRNYFVHHKMSYNSKNVKALAERF